MVWDKKRSYSKSQWKKKGVILTDKFKTYDELYDYYLSINNCELCNISFGEGKKCLDHDHKTGLFRNVVCNSCNRIKAVANKNNFMNSVIIVEQPNGATYMVTLMTNVLISSVPFMTKCTFMTYVLMTSVIMTNISEPISICNSRGVHIINA